jgi:hypothetical protein
MHRLLSARSTRSLTCHQVDHLAGIRIALFRDRFSLLCLLIPLTGLAFLVVRILDSQDPRSILAAQRLVVDRSLMSACPDVTHSESRLDPSSCTSSMPEVEQVRDGLIVSIVGP